MFHQPLSLSELERLVEIRVKNSSGARKPKIRECLFPYIPEGNMQRVGSSTLKYPSNNAITQSSGSTFNYLATLCVSCKHPTTLRVCDHETQWLNHQFSYRGFSSSITGSFWNFFTKPTNQTTSNFPLVTPDGDIRITMPALDFRSHVKAKKCLSKSAEIIKIQAKSKQSHSQPPSSSQHQIISEIHTNSIRANPNNEDKYCINHISETDEVYACMIDGHGGSAAAQFTKDNLINNIRCRMNTIHKKQQDFLKVARQDAETALEKHEAQQSADDPEILARPLSVDKLQAYEDSLSYTTSNQWKEFEDIHGKQAKSSLNINSLVSFALSTGFIRTDNDFFKHVLMNSFQEGYSGACTLLTYFPAKRNLCYIANAGDCRAVLGSSEEEVDTVIEKPNAKLPLAGESPSYDAISLSV